MSDRAPLPPEGMRTRGPVPTGSRLVLIRHGEAFCNANGIVGGMLGCGGLTALGQRQAAALAERLALSNELGATSAFYSSTLPRTVQTAAIIASALPATLEVVAQYDLSELQPGEGDGMTWTQFVDTFGVPNWDENPDAVLAPGGESWTGFYYRVQKALLGLVERHPGELVVAVVHGGVIEQALKMVYERGSAARLRLRTEHCSMTEVEYRDGAWHLLRYNDRAPLAATDSQ